MMKRMMAMLLAVVIILGVVPVLAEGTEITVVLSVSQYGEIVKDKNGNDMAYLPVTLTGKGSYTLDDVFREAHAVYYEGGDAGYASVYSEQYKDISITKMWGDDSGKFGYQVNGGTESVMGASHPMETGDRVDVALYKSAWPDTEAYATFDVPQKELYEDEPIELTLSYASGYDENGKQVFSPCEGATITVNGEETNLATDGEGKVAITLNAEGTYLISAKKDKTVVNEADPEAIPQIVPAITAPVCVVEVVKDPALTVIHNIAAEYTKVNFEDTAGNLSWILADMAVYEELFPESSFVLTDTRKEEGMKLLVDFLSTTTKPGDLAKGIIALRSLGYDARNLYTKNFEKVDAVKKLTNLVDAKDEAVTNMYNLPYVILALSQDDGYATKEQMDYLVNSAVATKNSWKNTIHPEYGYMGTDAMTPMILALAPFCETNPAVETAVKEAVEILKEEQREDGLIDGFEGYEPASTGLAICAFSALGVDVRTVKSGRENLIDGLLSTVNEEKNGFPNAFATEQGFRGLLAWQLLVQKTGKTLYDFSAYTMSEANVTGATNCPVVFEVTPETAVVTIQGVSEISKNCFDLAEGTYNYTVSATGYMPASGTVIISMQEQSERTTKKISITLTRKQSAPGGVSTGGVAAGGGIGGGATQAGDSQATKPDTLEGEKPAEMVLTENTFPDVKESDWYFAAVKYVYENSLFQGTENGFEPDTSMSRAMLVTVLHRLAEPTEGMYENPFTDVPEGQWYTDAILWAAENGIVNGVSSDAFDPDAGITREQLALILYRYAKSCGYETTETELTDFEDKDQISDYAIEAIRYAVAEGIMGGKTDTTLAPKDGATRAEVAAMLMRFSAIAR